MSFNAKDMTQGGQIANMRFRMFGQIANIIFYGLFILAVKYGAAKAHRTRCYRIRPKAI